MTGIPPIPEIRTIGAGPSLFARDVAAKYGPGLRRHMDFPAFIFRRFDHRSQEIENEGPRFRILQNRGRVRRATEPPIILPILPVVQIVPSLAGPTEKLLRKASAIESPPARQVLQVQSAVEPQDSDVRLNPRGASAEAKERTLTELPLQVFRKAVATESTARGLQAARPQSSAPGISAQRVAESTDALMQSRSVAAHHQETQSATEITQQGRMPSRPGMDVTEERPFFPKSSRLMTVQPLPKFFIGDHPISFRQFVKSIEALSKPNVFRLESYRPWITERAAATPLHIPRLSANGGTSASPDFRPEFVSEVPGAAGFRVRTKSFSPQLRGQSRLRSGSPIGRSFEKGFDWSDAVRANPSVDQHHSGAVIGRGLRPLPSRHPSSSEKGNWFQLITTPHIGVTSQPQMPEDDNPLGRSINSEWEWTRQVDTHFFPNAAGRIHALEFSNRSVDLTLRSPEFIVSSVSTAPAEHAPAAPPAMQAPKTAPVADGRPVAMPQISVREITDRVYRMLERRLITEKERRGIF